ncbi:hypothetical protein Hanom_Chr12g01096761 [Helianthus anomalus]
MQKHRRRKPMHFPLGNPSDWHTLLQLVSLKQIPLNLWLGVSHVLPSTTTGPPISVKAIHKYNIYS